jgi:hypothetical protein
MVTLYETPGENMRAHVSEPKRPVMNKSSGHRSFLRGLIM